MMTIWRRVGVVWAVTAVMGVHAADELVPVGPQPGSVPLSLEIQAPATQGPGGPVYPPLDGAGLPAGAGMAPPPGPGGRGGMPEIAQYDMPYGAYPQGMPGSGYSGAAEHWPRSDSPQGGMMPQGYMGEPALSHYGYGGGMPPVQYPAMPADSSYPMGYPGAAGGQVYPAAPQSAPSQMSPMREQRMRMMEERHARMDQWMARIEAMLGAVLRNQEKLLANQP